MIMTIGIPNSSATIKVATRGGRVFLSPEGFDREDPSHVEALATAIAMVKDASIDLPVDDAMHEKVALISIPGGNEQQQQATQPPAPGPGAQQAGNVQALMAQVQQMQQRIDALEQALSGGGGQPASPAAAGGSQPPAPASPQPQAPAAAPAPMGPGLGG